MADAHHDRIDVFISRWRNSGGAERANYVMYLTELCTLLGLPQPEPAKDDGTTDYRFEYPVTDGSPDDVRLADLCRMIAQQKAVLDEVRDLERALLARLLG